MIRLDSVTYSVSHGSDTIVILRGVDLHVNPGEVVGLMGPSGSGKSSLLSLLAGVERPVSGRVEVDGLDLGAQDPDRLARFRRERLGMVFQAFHLLPFLTALENVALPLELSAIPDARDRAREMLEQVGLAHRLRHRPVHLSGGEQQRVAIARAFVTRPVLILADELTGNLDRQTSVRVVELLFGLVAQWGTTMLLVTHDQELARRTQRCLRLENGVITSSGFS
ncbi:MAG: ABC transporter ATP-binding protein [Magnetococcales bacterium]|nr:ABC transporter ATP-binding protein [Magnetococcales bacterium]MBF0322151.1 ABC transporter ATP-binding protein [Magnetococcales bacterium]